MKTATDVKQDMSTLYEMLLSGTIELKHAAELANVAGKFLKADMQEMARELFLERHLVKPLGSTQQSIQQITMDS